LLVAGLVAAGVALVARRGWGRMTLAILAIALLGVATMQRALDGVAHSPLTGARDARDSATIAGTLTEDPEGGPYTARVLVRVARLDGRAAGSRTVLVTASGEAASRLRLLEAGDGVEMSGWLQPLAGFDRRLRWRHAVAHFDAVEFRAFEPATSPLDQTANALRHRVLAGTRHLPATERALVAGFLLGDTRALPREVEDEFRASGLTHLLAVSGENVAFVIALTRPVLRLLSLMVQLLAGLTLFPLARSAAPAR